MSDLHVTAWRASCRDQARRFLRLLDAEAESFTFQTFDDTQAKRRELARIMHGDLDCVADSLDDLQRERAGVFVTVNETDLDGRQAHNVVRIRAVFCDLDGSPLKPILEAGLAPHMICESSPGRFHAYWLTDDCPPNQFERVQRALALRFNGDPSVHDLPRVMRVPGFRHFKGEAQTCKLLDELGSNGPPYALTEIVGALQLDVDAREEKPAARPNSDGSMIAPGNRHAHLFASGRSMAHKGLSREAVGAALAAENQARCNPPLPDADIDYLAARSFEAKDAASWEDQAQRNEGGPKQKARGPRFPRVWLDDAQANIDTGYIVKGLIERGRLIVIFGPAGDGKTFFTVDMAGHISAGIPWRGRRVHSGLVVYVAAEAGASILRRFSAWRDHHLSEAREGRAPLAIITRAANLLNMMEVEELLAELRAIAEEAKLPLGLVVFDTLSRSIAGGDENSAEAMTRAIAAADAIRDELGAAVAIIHHSGKDATKGARGHSSLFAAADSVISVIERVATVDKSRDGTSGEQFSFELEVVNLGEDTDGDTITTCIVTPTDAAPKQRREPKLSGVARVALQALQEALAEYGQAMPGTSSIPASVRAVTIEQWRTRFALRYGSDGDAGKRAGDAVRQAFKRGREVLLSASAVQISDPYIWLAR